MSESETAATGRREFLQTVVAAPVLAAALVETAQAQPAQRNVFVKHATRNTRSISAKSR